MSTRNLARTVIEGGRHNTFQRRQTNAAQRCAERRALTLESQNGEFGDVVFPRRQPVPRQFDDKLAPAQRWLGRQVGRKWDKVRSELFERFDTRTTAGRHILFCHLLQMVEWGVVRSPWRRFEVDTGGILRRCDRRFIYERWRPCTIPEADRIWLGQRRVGQRQTRYYWFHPTPYGSFRQGHELTPEELARFLALPVHFINQQDPLQNPCTGSSPTTSP
jgi:hypothetical protein